MKNLIKKSIDNGKLFGISTLLAIVIAIFFSVRMLAEESFFSFISWNEILVGAFCSLILPLSYLASKIESGQKRIRYSDFGDFILCIIFTVFIIIALNGGSSIFNVLLFVGVTFFFLVIAIRFIYQKNKKLRVQWEAEKLAEEKRKADEEASRKKNLDLIFSSFFFQNRDTRLDKIENEKQAEDQIEFAELCNDLSDTDNPEHLTTILRKATALPIEHNELLTAVVLRRLTELRNCSIAELYKIESV